MSLPQLRNGLVTRAWRVGPAVCALVGDCRSVQAAEYAHVMFAAVPPEPKARVGVVAEVNPLASFGVSGGSHYLGVFDHKGHRNVDASDDLSDAKVFAKRALEVVAESLGIRERAEELEPSSVTLSLGTYSEPPALTTGALTLLGRSGGARTASAAPAPLEISPPMASIAPPGPEAAAAENPERLFQSVATLLVLDGHLAQSERDHLGVLGRRLGLSASKADRLTQQVIAGKKSIQLPGPPEARWRLFEELVTAAAADGEIHPTELKALGAVAGKLGLEPHELQSRLTAALGRIVRRNSP
ncbi:MAG: hypothetical protein FD180_3126 [Planctomycetota bacterium]|nr:MAG: hypothetical protein FD180_3126 [Planctomycetota bacterium]